jgi:hypothetical protein
VHHASAGTVQWYASCRAKIWAKGSTSNADSFSGKQSASRCARNSQWTGEGTTNAQEHIEKGLIAPIVIEFVPYSELVINTRSGKAIEIVDERLAGATAMKDKWIYP